MDRTDSRMRRGGDEEAAVPGPATPARPNQPVAQRGLRPFKHRLTLLSVALLFTVLMGVARLLPHIVSDPIEASKIPEPTERPRTAVDMAPAEPVGEILSVLPNVANAATANESSTPPKATQEPAVPNATVRDDEDYAEFGAGNEGDSVLIPSAAQCDATRAT